MVKTFFNLDHTDYMIVVTDYVMIVVTLTV